MTHVRQAGFTLLEVLVALVLVATSLTLGYSSVRNATLGSERLYDRVLAQWVLDNRRNEILIGARSVGDEPAVVDETQFGRRYLARIEGRAGDVRRATIRVANAAVPAAVLADTEVPVP
ncbi:MAG: type II secretion system minor pseudopilin GspI [Gammaproteobacteria bacterium]